MVRSLLFFKKKKNYRLHPLIICSFPYSRISLFHPNQRKPKTEREGKKKRGERENVSTTSPILLFFLSISSFCVFVSYHEPLFLKDDCTSYSFFSLKFFLFLFDFLFSFSAFFLSFLNGFRDNNNNNNNKKE